MVYAQVIFIQDSFWERLHRWNVRREYIRAKKWYSELERKGIKNLLFAPTQGSTEALVDFKGSRTSSYARGCTAVTRIWKKRRLSRKSI